MLGDRGAVRVARHTGKRSSSKLRAELYSGAAQAYEIVTRMKNGDKAETGLVVEESGAVKHPEPKALRWIAKHSSGLSEATNALGAVAVLLASVTEGAYQATFVVSGIVLLALAGVIRYFQNRRNESEETALATHNREKIDDMALGHEEHVQNMALEHEEYVQNLVSDLNMASVQARTALNESSKREKDKGLHGARTTVIALASGIIGPRRGVSVNFFEVKNSEDLRLEAADWGSSGRNGTPVSDRIFTKEDESLRKALRLEGRLIRDTDRLPESEEKPTRYKCFAVAPVFAGKCLYGLLTVDSKAPGSLNESDMQTLINLASTLSITFAADDAVAKIDLTSDVVSAILETDTPLGGEH